MLFKWNASVSMEPDLDDLSEMCKELQDKSFLNMSFFDYIKETNSIDLKEPEVAIDIKSSWDSFLEYLKHEVGNEIEISWKNRLFFATVTIKTDDIENLIHLLLRAGLLD
jgi:hypothetical protein